MSSTNKTSLGLNMWEASDKPVRQDFVNDNVIIDEKITKLKEDFVSGNVIVNEEISKLNSNLGNVAKTTTDNTFVGKQFLESALMGVDNPALVIKARTDQNQYSRPAIYLDCYGTVGASLFFDVDQKLKVRINGTVYTINMT
jgi:hypothetical protein